MNLNDLSRFEFVRSGLSSNIKGIPEKYQGRMTLCVIALRADRTQYSFPIQEWNFKNFMFHQGYAFNGFSFFEERHFWDFVKQNYFRLKRTAKYHSFANDLLKEFHRWIKINKYEFSGIS